jgi:predicted hydrocarbon binding protein
MTEETKGLDLIRLPAAALSALHRALHDQVGAEGAARALRAIGLETGEAFYERFRLWLSEAGAGSVDPETLSADEFWSRLSAFFGYLGWGSLRSETLHPGLISLTLSPWVEARHAAGPVEGCHFTTGLIAEVLRQVAGGDLAALEVECSPSDGGHSRIIIGNADAMDSLFASMREGVGYREALAALA